MHNLVELLRTYSNFVPRILKQKRDYVNPFNIKDSELADSKLTDQSYAPSAVVKSYRQYQKSLSDEELELCIRLYSEGASVYNLAEKFGCHRTTISRSLKKAGIEVTHEASKKEALTDQVLKMYSDYNKPADIGKALGINCSTVRKILHANHIYVRKSWEYPNN